MLTTRHYFPKTGSHTVTVEDDGTVTVSSTERITRTFLSGRSKGAVEHTVLNLHFDNVDDARSWFTETAEQLS